MAATAVASAKSVAPLIHAPLSGTVTKGVWQYGDEPYKGMSGGAMHYAYLLPANYATAGSYPVLVYEHENTEGNRWYENHGDPTTNTIVYQLEQDRSYNTIAFRTRYPAIIIVPFCDQTDGTGGESGQNFGGFNDNGFTNVNEDAVVAVVNHFIRDYSVYPWKVYITGDSLGGIGTEAEMLDFNAVNGPCGKVFTAGLPFAGQIWLRHPSPDQDPATIKRMRGVPMFMVSGSHDTTSDPNHFNRPFWTDMSGNTNYPPPPGAKAGRTKLWYMEDPKLGHDVWNTYRQLAADGGHGDFLYNWLFSQTSPGAPR
jgi:hypothetical protein